MLPYPLRNMNLRDIKELTVAGNNKANIIRKQEPVTYGKPGELFLCNKGYA